MPRKARELTPIEVKRLTAPGLFAVGGVAGLHLQVTKSGARTWILRATVAGKRRDIGLGGYPDTTLAMARDKARETRERIAQGIDPVAERQRLRSTALAARLKDMTFEKAAEAVIAKKQAEARNPKHAKQWASTLETYAYPVLGAMSVADIELAHVKQVLEPIWQTKTETATRVRQRIEAVLSWAAVNGHRSGENPARWKGNLDAILPQPSKVAKVEHHRAMPMDEMHGFMEALAKRDGMAARCLMFTILTAARSGEARAATWEEIDLAGKVWTIPADRMKAGREHRVPLAPEALALLATLPRREDSPLVFPAPRGGVLSDATLAAVLKRMKVYDKATVHGFRSTFRDWAAERTSTPHHVAEMALAHTIKNHAEAAYRRGDLLAKRATLMTQWARFLATPPATGNVAPIRGGASEAAEQ